MKIYLKDQNKRKIVYDILNIFYDNGEIIFSDEGELVILDDKIIFVSKNKIKDDLTINKDDVFKEFYKASDSRTGSSTGLGLAICKGLAEKLNGKISADIDGEYFSIILSFDKIKKASK